MDIFRPTKGVVSDHESRIIMAQLRLPRVAWRESRIIRLDHVDFYTKKGGV